jgi:1,2-diacylglycerol 3-beta-glucosyltransferase
MSIILVASWALGLTVLPAALYLGLLAVLARPTRAPADVAPTVRFAVVVPAHNEQDQIAQTVASLKAVDYPANKFKVVVVADNCSDATAARAAAAGADVMQRTHDTLRGKGYALEHAFDRLLAGDEADALVVIDADTVVSKNLLRAFAARIVAGELAVQAEYGVRNPDASWRTRLMAVALAMFHRLRSLGRERLGVSAGLRGNGMCFTRTLLSKHPHKAYGLVEDVEYGIAIGLAGIRIAYADEAKVYGEMVSSAQASESQRQRWEGGRMQLVRDKLPTLVKAAVRQRSAMLLDLACDLAVPPLSYVGLGIGLGVALEVGVRLALGSSSAGASWTLWAVSAACLLAYVGRGVLLSGLGFKAVSALAWAPVYVVWKVIVALKPGRKRGAWIRTRRESES